MIMIGIVQTTTSILLEWAQFGMYLASLLEARYFQAKMNVMKITGITTISINAIAVRISVRCSTPIAPLGSINTILQPLSNPEAATNDSIPMRRLYFLSLI